MKVSVSVPATCANLGPGFDVFGAALGLRNAFSVEMLGRNEKTSFTVKSASGTVPEDKTNLFYRAFTGTLGSITPVAITIEKNIPCRSGLGSSATAVAAGIICAKLVKAGRPPADAAAFLRSAADAAIEMEGHPDNVVPTIFGGLCLAYRNGSGHGFRKVRIPRSFTPVIVHPHIEKISTNHTRRMLPSRVLMKDAVFNISRAALLAVSFSDGDAGLLREAMQDRLHQDLRMRLYPECRSALDRLISLGACGAALSGSGPALVAIWSGAPDRGRIVREMKKLYSRAGLAADVYFPGFVNSGAVYRLAGSDFVK